MMCADGVKDFGREVDKAHGPDVMPLGVKPERFIRESDKLFHRRCLSIAWAGGCPWRSFVHRRVARKPRGFVHPSTIIKQMGSLHPGQMNEWMTALQWHRSSHVRLVGAKV